MKPVHLILFAIAIFVFGFEFAPAVSLGQKAAPQTRPVFDESFSHWPEQTKIKGRVLINRGLQDFSQAQPLLKRIVSDNKKVFAFAPETDPLREQLEELCDEGNFSSETNDVAGLKFALSNGNVVYIAGTVFTSQQLLQLKNEFRQFIDNGGTLIADSACADVLGAFTNDAAAAGLNLLPDCCLACDYDGSEKSKTELADLATANPVTVGIGIEPDTMLMLSGRTLVSIGNGDTTLLIPANKSQAEIVTRLTSRRSPESATRADLTQWRRMAIDQTLEPFPPADPKTPRVDNGTLYIVGGGGTPRGLMAEMIEKAGGLENARLVYIPCSESDDVGQRQRTVASWKRMGVKHATFLHTKDRNRANSDDDFLKPLEDATMLWFGGGRQWNFADSYYGTRAHRMMKEVLHRGGVIGGSSAGASIQGRFLARATPIGNSNILAPGYERGGLGFLSGVAIDQHFSQRGRQRDMTKLVQKYPQLLGIGIDESTAIRVEKSAATVIGRGKVYFYDFDNSNRPAAEEDADYVALAAGSVYDLEQRQFIATE